MGNSGLEFAASPSQIWSDWLWQLSFLQSINDEQLRLHVGFGYYLGAPIENDLWRVNKWNTGDIVSGNKIIDDYKHIINGIDPQFYLTELDKKYKLISIPFLLNEKDLNLSADVVRMQVEVANMYNLGILSGVESILEIGGGYGQLCAGLINSRACNRYYIVDFPEILNVVNRWISTLELGIEIYNYTDINFSDKNLYKSGLHLIPNRLLPMLTSAVNVDLLINTNSFFEMSNNQIHQYLSLKYINFNVLYSSNRDRSILNTELNSLSEIFKDYGQLWPDYNSLNYKKLVSLKKKVHLLYPDKTSSLPNFNFEKLHGIFGKEMPSMS